jgi:hypothetical protein
MLRTEKRSSTRQLFLLDPMALMVLILVRSVLYIFCTANTVNFNIQGAEFNESLVSPDWEFPGLTSQGGQPEDPMSLTSLLKDLREAINNETLSAGQSPLLLSLAATINPSTYENGYQPDLIHVYVDWYFAHIYPEPETL